MDTEKYIVVADYSAFGPFDTSAEAIAWELKYLAKFYPDSKPRAWCAVVPLVTPAPEIPNGCERTDACQSTE